MATTLYILGIIFLWATIGVATTIAWLCIAKEKCIVDKGIAMSMLFGPLLLIILPIALIIYYFEENEIVIFDFREEEKKKEEELKGDYL